MCFRRFVRCEFAWPHELLHKKKWQGNSIAFSCMHFGDFFRGCLVVFFLYFCSPWCSFSVFRTPIFLSEKCVFFVLRFDFLVQMVSTVSLGAKPPDPLGQCIDPPPRNPKKKFPVCDARERSERVLGRKFWTGTICFTEIGSPKSILYRLRVFGISSYFLPKILFLQDWLLFFCHFFLCSNSWGQLFCAFGDLERPRGSVWQPSGIFLCHGSVALLTLDLDQKWCLPEHCWGTKMIAPGHTFFASKMALASFLFLTLCYFFGPLAIFFITKSNAKRNPKQGKKNSKGKTGQKK